MKIRYRNIKLNLKQLQTYHNWRIIRIEWSFIYSWQSITLVIHEFIFQHFIFNNEWEIRSTVISFKALNVCVNNRRTNKSIITGTASATRYLTQNFVITSTNSFYFYDDQHYQQLFSSRLFFCPYFVGIWTLIFLQNTLQKFHKNLSSVKLKAITPISKDLQAHSPYYKNVDRR